MSAMTGTNVIVLAVTLVVLATASFLLVRAISGRRKK